MTDDKSKAELKAELETVRAQNERLRNKLEEEQSALISRRSVLARAAGLAAAGAVGVTASAGSAAAATGTFPIESEPPLVRIRGERMNFVVLSSDPSSPDGGEMWVVD